MSKTTLAHGTMFITVSTVVFMISGYLINILLGRYLGPASYGIYGVIISLMTVINLTQTSGLPQAVAKFIAEDENRADAVLKSGLIVQSISTVLASFLFFLLAVPLAKALHDMSLIPYIQVSSLVFPLYGIYSLYLNYYNGLHYFRSQALMSIVYAIAKFIGVIIFVILFKVYGAILGFIISPLIALLFFMHIPKVRNINFPYKKLIFFSIPLVGFAIFSNLLQSVDLFFVKSLLHSDKYTGFYTANQNIAELPYYGVTALASVLFPGISRSVSQNLHDKTRRLIQRSIRFSLLVIMPSILLISATSSEILTYLYSSLYHFGSESLAVLVIGSGFFTIFVIFTTIISSSGFPHKSAILAGLGVLITSGLCIFLIPLFGLVGASLATTFASFFMMVAASVILYRKFKILISISSFLKIFFSSLIIFILAKIIILPNFFLPLVYLILFGIYGLILVILKEITKEDIMLVQSLLPRWVTNKINI